MSMALPPGHLPTPPASTSAVQLCFPSPTSVAHILSHHPPASPSPQSDDEINLKISNSPHPTSHSPSPPPAHPLPIPLQPPDSTLQPPSPPNPPNPSPSQTHYHYPQLRNPAPTPPLSTVTKAQFTALLNQFVSADPPVHQLPLPTLTSRIRNLLDHLDALTEQLSLRVTNNLFDALSHPNCLSVLVFLLSDISATSPAVVTDVRKTYRYPYLVANILANGPMSFRDAFIASPPHLHHLLSFLDGNVVLSTLDPPHPSPPPGSTRPPHSYELEHQQVALMYARQNPTIVGNVVQVLVSYMETSPEALLEEIRQRPTFLPALVNLLHFGSVPSLFNSLILDRCVDDLASMDPRHVSFDPPMATALKILADGQVFLHLSAAFVKATQTIYDVLSEGRELGARREHYEAEQMSYNIVRVFAVLVKKTVRALRLEPTNEEYRALRVFSDEETAQSLVQIVRVGIQLFRGTESRSAGQLHTALGGAIETLKYVQEDRERRAASMVRQPELLDVGGFESNVVGLLRELMEVLVDVALAERSGETRLKIAEMFVQVQMICSEELVQCLDAMRWGEVALKMMVMHARNSLLHQVILQGVEWGLLSERSGGKLALHWLGKSKLAEQVMRIWAEADGGQLWDRPGDVAERPYLSAVLHMACCVEHWIAMKTEAGEDVEEVIGSDTLEDFHSFWQNVVHKVMTDEKKLLAGPKPKRKQTRGAGFGIGRLFGGFGGTGKATSRGGGLGLSLGGKAHLVRSKSGHRFGWMEPASGTRSRLDDVFAERDEGGSGPFGRFGQRGRSATSFASVFDVDSDSTF